MGKTSSQVKEKWNQANYDELKVRVPKGQKATVQAAAQEVGESVNQYTQGALLARMGLSEWPKEAKP